MNNARSLLRKLVTFVVGCAIALGMLIVVSIPSQNARNEQARLLLEAQQEAAHASLATACVLTLPVTEEGRDERLVGLCFTQYGLEAPEIPYGG